MRGTQMASQWIEKKRYWDDRKTRSVPSVKIQAIFWMEFTKSRPDIATGSDLPSCS